MLSDVRSDCETVGLRLSAKQIDRIQSLLERKATTVGQLANAVAELHNRIGDEIQESLFVQIPPSKATFLNDLGVADSLGAELAEATTDLEEAARCMAFGVNTAAAFHLMRVIEYCLRKFGDRLGVDFLDRMSWGPVIAEIDAAIKGSAGHDKESLAQVLTQFISLKNAWRNSTMHVGRTYDDGQIAAVYMSVRFLIDTLKPILVLPPVV